MIVPLIWPVRRMHQGALWHLRPLIVNVAARVAGPGAVVAIVSDNFPPWLR